MFIVDLLIRHLLKRKNCHIKTDLQKNGYTQVLKLTGQLRMKTESHSRAQPEVQTGNGTVIST